MEFINPRNNVSFLENSSFWRAPDDGGYLNLPLGEGLSFDQILRSENSIWRYQQALRVNENSIISFGEGMTPLIDESWRNNPVAFKLDYLMPTGSFKDRGMSVLVSHLNQFEIKCVTEDSSGNAGASLAFYCAKAGIECQIFSPASAPMGKLTQIKASGAKLQAIEGSRDEVHQAALQASENSFYAGHSWHPYFLEGTKTIAYEIWEQSKGNLPDNIIAPLGQGGNILGCFIGFQELLRAKSISKIPKIFAVQSENCAPFYFAKQNRPAPPSKNSIADGILSASPVRVNEVLEAIRTSNGDIIIVSEEQIKEALHLIHKKGYFIEPTSAAALAGFSKLLTTEKISANDKTLVLLTGNGLKATEVITRLIS